MKQKYCLDSIEPFDRINQSLTNKSTTKQTYSFSKTPRFQSIQPNCPVSTYNKSLPRKNSGAIIGYGKKVDFTLNTSVSPGSKYKINTLFDSNKNKNKGYTLTLDRQKLFFDSYIDRHKLRMPGVGKYHLETETAVAKSKAPVYTMRLKTKVQDRTLSIEPQNQNPSPAHYENNPQKSNSLFSTSFKRLSYSGSKSKRFFNQSGRVPGPGQYENPTNLSNVGRYIMSTHKGGTKAKFDNSKRVTKLDEIQRASKNLPGPGSYRQSSQFGQYDGNVYRTISSTSKRLLSKK